MDVAVSGIRLVGTALITRESSVVGVSGTATRHHRRMVFTTGSNPLMRSFARRMRMVTHMILNTRYDTLWISCVIAKNFRHKSEQSKD
jgi:hypothetical protein